MLLWIAPTKQPVSEARQDKLFGRRRYIELGEWKTINLLSVWAERLKGTSSSRIKGGKMLVDIHPCSHHHKREKNILGRKELFCVGCKYLIQRDFCQPESGSRTET